MDGLRKSGFDLDDRLPSHELAIDAASDAPPPAIGQDERRMQVRAYNYWAGLLGKRRFPTPDALVTGDWPDFSANAVLLHFTDGLDDPDVIALGSALAAECGDVQSIGRLSRVPGRSVLSRITDHYLQIIANEAPIGFEAEFVNQHGATILYRGILLPFSTNDVMIDYIYGVINWKQLADQRTTDALMQEIGHALDQPPDARAPIALSPDEAADDPWNLIDWTSHDSTGRDWADGPAMSAHAPAPLDLAPYAAKTAAEPHTLGEWLEKARASALRAIASEDRTRQSLYGAISRAWDFALAAEAAPADYARLIAQAGLHQQDRAPLIPLLKLVFGSDYDKTRLTEYATVLGHARRLGLGTGGLGPCLAETPGGIKAIVASERAARRNEGRAATPATTRTRAWHSAARALPVHPLGDLRRDGAEFALILIRRHPGGDPAMIGEISDDAALLARAVRRCADAGTGEIGR